MTQPSTRYTKTAVILHWLIALFLVVMFVLGWFMTDLPKEATKQSAFDLGIMTWHTAEEISPRTFYFNLHKSLGFTIFVLILVRIFWRITHKPPAMLTSYKAIERKLATGAHHLLYLLMFAIPVTGLIMTLYSKYGLKWFGVTVFSGLDNSAIRDVFESAHEIVGIILLAVLAVHVIGALKHKFIDKDETLKRMSLK
jgi:cytochrome b561